MSEVVQVTDGDREGIVAQAATLLRNGRLVVLPTDTVYGIAADAFVPTGTAKVFAAKGRSRRQPLPVLVRSPKQLIGITESIPPAAERLMAAYWPGPLTIVLRSAATLTWDLGDDDGTVAVRMPLDELTLEIIRAVGPIACTSANRSGQPPATDAETARRQLGDSVALYVDDGPRTDSAPSTIVALTGDQPRILREGTISTADVLAVAEGRDVQAAG